MNNMPIYAIAVFNDTIKGTVKLRENLNDNVVIIDLNLTGLKPNSAHGFHVHEAGDLTDKCTSMCAHFNPYGKTHGCPGMSERHVGDLGNIVTNSKGEAKYSFYDNYIKKIHEITPEKLQLLAKTYLDWGQMTIVSAG